ncbi:MAG: hypothetical protein HDR25_03850 [Lachnospiraceae bacterium]|nr:hypothetical protein [Lachnospiraceae bacterium]
MPNWLKNKLFNGQRPNKEIMLILFLSGILIFVILLPTENSGKNNSSYQKQREPTASENRANEENASLSEMASLLNYKKTLESELEAFLSGVSGVDEVKALIYLNASWEHEVEKDINLDAEARGEETVYTVNEYGQEVPFVKNSVCPQIEGVAVVVKGNVSDDVRVGIVRTIMALYGLEANKVEVIN